jgi:hypothetical protein
MITIKHFLEVTDYKISEGSEYLWDNFGPRCRRLEYWDGDSFNTSILYDTATQKVYQMETHDYTEPASYRWTCPEYVESFLKENENRGIDAAVAYGDVYFTVVEDAVSILELSRNIFLAKAEANV